MSKLGWEQRQENKRLSLSGYLSVFIIIEKCNWKHTIKCDVTVNVTKYYVRAVKE